MSEKQELFIKKGVFLIDKYLFPKKKSSYLVKGFIGSIIFWIYEFLTIFGGITNYQKMLSASLNQINSSEQIKNQLADFRNSPMFIAIIVAVIILSYIIGYLIMSFVQLIVDLMRRRVFRGFEGNEPL